jgi:hypothetical protein
MGASSCENKLDGAYGIHVTTNADGTKSVTVDPAGGLAGSGVKLAADTVSGLPGAGTLIGMALTVLFGAGGLAQTILKNRAVAAVAASNAALATEQTAHNATVAGVSAFTVANPTLATPLLAHIDAAHDAAGVAPAVQDQIQGAISPV